MQSNEGKLTNSYKHTQTHTCTKEARTSTNKRKQAQTSTIKHKRKHRQAQTNVDEKKSPNKYEEIQARENGPPHLEDTFRWAVRRWDVCRRILPGKAGLRIRLTEGRLRHPDGPALAVEVRRQPLPA